MDQSEQNGPTRIEIERIELKWTEWTKLDRKGPDGTKMTEWTELDQIRPKWTE